MIIRITSHESEHWIWKKKYFLKYSPDCFHLCCSCTNKNLSSPPMLHYLPKQQCLSSKPQIVLSCVGAFPAPFLHRPTNYKRVEWGAQDVLWITGPLMSRHPREHDDPAGHPAHMSTYMPPQSVCLRAKVWHPQKVRATIINPSGQC